ncbi:MAG: GAF domain-containing protein [Deltaproteobacteria bacterium]|nr:GAF domain-containing protein [Deltaproteobacteria bacterium]
MQDKTEEETRLAAEKEVFKRQYLKMRVNYENKIKELSVIKELVDTLRLTGIYDRNALFMEQLKIVKKYSTLEQIFLMLLNDELRMLEIVASSDDDGLTSRPTFIRLDEGTAGQVISKKIPIILNDVEESCCLEEKESVRGQSLLCVPVIHNNTAVGVLNLVHRMKDGFDQNQVSFFSLVADQIATALALSRLYTQMIKEENKRFLLSRFFSKNVTEEILGSKGLLRPGGERKRATIVFADLRGFTSISEGLDQEKVVEILNAFFSHMTPIIFKNDGTLDKLLGDGMMAIFGAPISHDDDPVRALRTVIEMIRALKVFNVENRPKGWPELKIGIGVNTGDVVAGYIGSVDHLNYTVIGDAVNVAQRLQSIAEPNEILISRDVKDVIHGRYSEVEGLKGLTPLPAQKVKGKKVAIEVFRVEF